MTDTLHKFTNLFTKEGRKINEVEHEASEIISQNLNSIVMQINAAPEHKLTPAKIYVGLEHIHHTVEELMTRINKHAEDLPEYHQVQEVMDVCKLSSLEKYIELIPQSETVEPFATFAELHKLSQADLPEDQERITLLFRSAVEALFIHKDFETTLVEKLVDEENYLAQKCPDDNDLERRNVVLFLAHYEDLKILNPSLRHNQLLESEIYELKSLLFFQDQTHLIENELDGISTDLEKHLEFWATFLNALTPEQQQQKLAIISTTNACADAYAAYMEKQPWS